ncbi:MAG: ATP-binding cassette domain-containing protein, partial [Gemmatimonadetes bacterium]|nr:ATP-binding cassette domain-containing protein [Gemmatimonadota bacterium]
MRGLPSGGAEGGGPASGGIRGRPRGRRPDGPGRPAVIVVEDVSFSYHLPTGDEVPTLRGLSLEIGDSGSLAVIGPNGSGKSTLARCLNGLIVPRSGRVLVDGLD